VEAEGEPLNQLRSAVKPAKWAADAPAVAHFVGFGSFTTALLGLTPFMLSPASQAQIEAFKTRSQWFGALAKLLKNHGNRCRSKRAARKAGYKISFKLLAYSAWGSRRNGALPDYSYLK
jgi:hypothetical protein